jgi:O-antigen ligase
VTALVASRYGDAGGRLSARAVAPVLVGGAVVAGLVAGQLVASGRSVSVLALGLAVVPVVLWKKPELGPTLVVVAALGVEQFDHFGGAGPSVGALTSHIPLFHGLPILPLNPADVLLCLLLAVWVAKSGTGATAPWPRSATATAVFSLVAVVAFGVLNGVASGGQTRLALLEARPYVYLAATFALASVLVTTRAAIRGVLWGFVVVIGLKAVQGLLIFVPLHDSVPRPESVLGHEEALFFALFLLLTAGLWLFEVPGRLRTTATLLAPIVLAADLANGRRAAWLVLAVGFITLVAVGSMARPTRRRFLARIVLSVVAVIAIYVPAYWDRTGGFAQPARAIRSIVAPSARDASSNLYRLQEDANLLLNIRQAGALGKGFGVPIDYALPIVDLSEVNPFIEYIPHNGVLYVLMRVGVLGGIAFWSLLAVGILAGCRLAKSADRELALVGALTACVVVAYAFEGAVDQGFFFYRIAFVVGTLLGLTHAARRLAATDARAAKNEPAAVASPAPART